MRCRDLQSVSDSGEPVIISVLIFSSIEFTVKSSLSSFNCSIPLSTFTILLAFSLLSLGYCQNGDICSRHKYTPRPQRLSECEPFHIPNGILSVCTLESWRVCICRPHDSFTQCKAFKTFRYRGHQGFALGERKSNWPRYSHGTRLSSRIPQILSPGGSINREDTVRLAEPFVTFSELTVYLFESVMCM